jgi:hypothetical protein
MGHRAGAMIINPHKANRLQIPKEQLVTDFVLELEAVIDDRKEIITL